MASSTHGSLKLRTVCNELEDIKHKAYEIGIQLGVPHNKMMVFKQEGNVLTAAMNFWLCGNVEDDDIPVSWTSIVAALESKQVGEVGLAATLCTKYCGQLSESKNCKDDIPDDRSSSPSDISLSSLDSDIEADLEQILNRNLKLIHEQYADYVDCILTIVEDKNIKAERLSSFLLNLHAFVDDKQKVAVLADMRTEIRNASSNVKIFDVLGSKYASFLDYDIFQAILKKYGRKENREGLDYPDHLEAFLKQHKISEFIKINPKLEKINDTSKKLNIKLNVKKTQNLHSLKKVKEAVANVLGLKPSALRLLSIKKGCVEVTWLIPATIAKIIFKSGTTLTAEQEQKLKEVLVLQFDCNGFKYEIQKGDNGLAKTVSSLSWRPQTVKEVREMVWKFYRCYYTNKITPYYYTNIRATPLHEATESDNVEIVSKEFKREKFGINCIDSIGWTPLHYACAVGNLDMVRMLVSEFKADASIQDDDGCTALMLAALAGHDTVVHTLLSEYQCPVDTKDKHGNGLLAYACAGGSVSIANTLVHNHNADDKIANHKGNTPLHVAALFRQDQVALTLINELGCDTTVTGWNGRSLLHNACQGGSVSLVQALIHDHNADVLARDNENNTPLHIAADYGQDQVALTLINELGCDTTVTGWNGRSLLHNACQGGSVSLVQALIRDHNADVLARDNENNTPLHIAADYGQDQVALTLINEFGCDTTVTGWIGMSLLHKACQGGSVSLVQALIRDHNADVLARDNENNTPLHIAADYGQDQVALTLINEFGCDTTVTGWIGMSLLHKACQGGSVSLVQALIRDHNADVLARDNENNTPLHIAAKYGKDQVALTLINEFGCDTTVTGWSGRSLLHKACRGGSVRLVQALICEHNADVLARDDDNNTPLQIAVMHGHEKLAAILRDRLVEQFDVTVRSHHPY